MAEPRNSARTCALDIVGAVLDRQRPLDEALDDHAGLARLAARDRAFAHLLVATTLRRLGQIDGLLAHCLARPLPESARAVRHALRLGVCQIVFLGTPAHAAVDTTVALVASRAAKPFKGLVNAVLRRLASEGRGLADAQDAARLNTPDWLWQSWLAAYGEATTRAIAAVHVSDPPLDITVKADAALWADRLEATVLPTGTLRRIAGGRVTELAGYAAGEWWVQDAAAALPARLLGRVDGATVLDLCAAPGGKTAQLALAGARVVAVDRGGRLARLSENLARLGFGVETVDADIGVWRPGAPAPFVLLDAPCTATGTIRRHPDIPHVKAAADVGRFAAIQDRLLDAAADMLAPGGTLVYCVCSLQPEEGTERVSALLARDPRFARVAIEADETDGLAELVTDGGDMRSLPCHLAESGGLDGFYAARLRCAD
jgi:16S rRNA (cytosine967-C5)-methyltransferase